MALHIVCETSGSMHDNAKPFIMRTLVMSVAQWVLYGYGHTKIILWSWSSETYCIDDWDIGSEFPEKLLLCTGTANASSLIQSLGDKKFDSEKVLLLTDAFWSREDTRALEKWKDSLPSDTLRIIKIGTDANPRLKWSGLFTSDDLFAALDGWFQESDEWA